MYEQMVVSLWSSMASWCTPTTLFLFLNLMIGTLVVTSRFTSHNKNNNPPDQDQQQQQQPGFDSFHQLGRPASLLDRVKSISFSGYRPESAVITAFRQAERDADQNQNPNPDPYSSSSSKPLLVKTPSLIDRVKMFNFSFNQYDPSEHTISDSGSDSDHNVENRNSSFNQYDPSEHTHSDSGSDHYVENRNSSFNQYNPSEHMHSDSGSDHYVENREAVTEPEFDEPRAIIKKSASAVPAGSSDILVKLKRSVSEKLGIGRVETEEEEEETVERRRPATVRERSKKKKHGGGGGGGGDGGGGESDTASSGDEECVNAKADDFINNFRQQLKLQRLKSLLRYSEMINRGSSR